LVRTRQGAKTTRYAGKVGRKVDGSRWKKKEENTRMKQAARMEMPENVSNILDLQVFMGKSIGYLELLSK
jgi:hypothetical protein